MGPGVAVAEVRSAVRACLSDLAAGDLVLVACSGGADSLALAAAAGFVAPRLGLRAGGVTVDHGLQSGSAERARKTTALLSTLGLDPVHNTAVTVPSGTAKGPEAAARQARYAALDAAAGEYGAVAVLLGHTLDDQAETVLLGLARGSAPGRSLACRRAAAFSPGRCSASAGPSPPRRARRSACTRGRTRTTRTAGSPGSGSGSTRCRRSRKRSDLEWPRRLHGPPPSCEMMPRC